MRLLHLAVLAASLGGCASPAHSVDPKQAAARNQTQDGPAGHVVVTTASRDTAALSYRFFLGVQYELHQHMPPEPHLVDLWYRLSYSGMRETERDAHVPPERYRPVAKGM